MFGLTKSMTALALILALLLHTALLACGSGVARQRRGCTVGRIDVPANDGGDRQDCSVRPVRGHKRRGVEIERQVDEGR